MVNDSQFKSTPNKSTTSLANAIPQADERKTFSYNNCDDEENFPLNLSHSNEQTSELPTDSQVTDRIGGVDSQTTSLITADDKPGFFTKFLRRIMAAFKGHKIDVWPGRNTRSLV